MKKFLILLCISLVSGSCKSVPSAPLSSDECLVLIRTEAITAPGTEVARSYRVHLLGREKALKISKGKKSILPVLIWNDKTILQKITSAVTNPDYYGDSSNQIFNRRLPYSSERIVVADFKIVIRVRKDGAGIMSSLDLEPMSDKEREAIFEEAAADPDLAGWFD